MDDKRTETYNIHKKLKRHRYIEIQEMKSQSKLLRKGGRERGGERVRGRKRGERRFQKEMCILPEN